jgi:hemin uptake protein HemP
MSAPTSGDTSGRPDTRSAPVRVNIDTILRGRQEVIIEHRNEEYRLRITSNGKLLLTK